MDIEWRQIEHMDVPKEYSEETSFAFSTSDWKANGICGYSIYFCVFTLFS